MRDTPTAVYINSQRTRYESGTAEGPAQMRIRGFAKRARAAARGMPKATEANVAFFESALDPIPVAPCLGLAKGGDEGHCSHVSQIDGQRDDFVRNYED